MRPLSFRNNVPQGYEDQKPYLSEVKKVVAPETTLTAKEVRSMWQTLCMAKEVGKRLGPSSVL